MEININYVSRKHFDRNSIFSWMWYYRPYKHIKGFILRIFGVHFNVKENDATEKLITIAKSKINGLQNR